MLIVKSVTVGTERYSDAYECRVAFQVGPQSYSTVDIKLNPEATREIVELAVAKASAMLTVVPSDIRIAGEPRAIPSVEEAAPEFAVAEEPLPTVEAYPVPATEEPI